MPINEYDILEGGENQNVGGDITNEPTGEVTEEPVEEVTDEVTPTSTPTPTPIPADPVTEEPTDDPTEEPTDVPTDEPTDEPTEEPTDEPTEEPTDEPTEEPTEEPTSEPTSEPTDEPTEEPTGEPEPSEGYNIFCCEGAECTISDGNEKRFSIHVYCDVKKVEGVDYTFYEPGNANFNMDYSDGIVVLQRQCEIIVSVPPNHTYNDREFSITFTHKCDSSLVLRYYIIQQKENFSIVLKKANGQNVNRFSFDPFPGYFVNDQNHSDIKTKAQFYSLVPEEQELYTYIEENYVEEVFYIYVRGGSEKLALDSIYEFKENITLEPSNSNDLSTITENEPIVGVNEPTPTEPPSELQYTQLDFDNGFRYFITKIGKDEEDEKTTIYKCVIRNYGIPFIENDKKYELTFRHFEKVMPPKQIENPEDHSEIIDNPKYEQELEKLRKKLTITYLKSGYSIVGMFDSNNKIRKRINAIFDEHGGTEICQYYATDDVNVQTLFATQNIKKYSSKTSYEEKPYTWFTINEGLFAIKISTFPNPFKKSGSISAFVGAIQITTSQYSSSIYVQQSPSEKEYFISSDDISVYLEDYKKETFTKYAEITCYGGWKGFYVDGDTIDDGDYFLYNDKKFVITVDTENQRLIENGALYCKYKLPIIFTKEVSPSGNSISEFNIVHNTHYPNGDMEEVISDTIRFIQRDYEEKPTAQDIIWNKYVNKNDDENNPTDIKTIEEYENLGPSVKQSYMPLPVNPADEILFESVKSDTATYNNVYRVALYTEISDEREYLYANDYLITPSTSWLNVSGSRKNEEDNTENYTTIYCYTQNNFKPNRKVSLKIEMLSENYNFTSQTAIATQKGITV